ncbi:site-specific integrase [Pseudonocardia sp. GCM10023141]|uniref:site-specific integrase n=1 Tax=Pseudonocardia sp. GCM10023141 TaxID=3252653 RepID=UPI00361B40C4
MNRAVSRIGEPAVELVDGNGEPIAEVSMFLRLLVAKAYSPNTVRAYAFDLVKLFRFFHERGLTSAEFSPARAVEFLTWLRRSGSTSPVQRRELGVVRDDGRQLSGRTCNRVLAAVTNLSDPVVLADYQAVLQPGAVLAGPQADSIRNSELIQEAVTGLKTNFYKTELELGRCLRLPQEGPCECDLYQTCSKFVTTPDYAPRLRERLQVEQQLIADAADRGWTREVERHERVATRVRCLLDELGEPARPA